MGAARDTRKVFVELLLEDLTVSLFGCLGYVYRVTVSKGFTGDYSVLETAFAITWVVQGSAEAAFDVGWIFISHVNGFEYRDFGIFCDRRLR